MPIRRWRRQGPGRLAHPGRRASPICAPQRGPRRAAGPPRFGPELAAYEDRDAERDRGRRQLGHIEGSALPRGLGPLVVDRAAEELLGMYGPLLDRETCRSRHLLIMTLPVS